MTIEPQFAMGFEGYGSALGSRLVTNEEMGAIMMTADKKLVEPEEGWDQWISESFGIKERPWVGEGEDAGTLAVAAGEQALKMSGLDPEDIDGLIVATSTNVLQYPALANYVQDQLGLRKAYITDLVDGCSGYVHAMAAADAFLARRWEKALIIGTDAVSTVTNHADPATAPIFGDGSGAKVLGRDHTGTKGVIGYAADADGSHRKKLFFGHGEKMHMEASLARPVMRMIVDITEAALEDAGKTKEEIDWFVMHQPNGRIIDKIMRLLGLEENDPRVGRAIDHIGNLSAATVPVLYAEMADTGKIQPGNVITFNGVAGGVNGVTLVYQG